MSVLLMDGIDVILLVLTLEPLTSGGPRLFCHTTDWTSDCNVEVQMEQNSHVKTSLRTARANEKYENFSVFE